MAASAALRRALRRIAEAVHDFVKEKGWNPHGYRLFYRADEDWNHIHLVFVTPQLKGWDYYTSYGDVTGYLKKHLQDVPGLYESLGVVIMDEEQFHRGGIYQLGPEYADFADEFQDYWAFDSTKGQN